MNERIEELWIKSWTTEAPGYDYQKFALLIVAECAQACINMGNDYEIKSAGQYQAELFAFAIKQHFGVEE
jgi:hypothetical protein